MANKLRSINTKFWNDPYIEELNSDEKLLFLYCLTSPHSNLLGIYEVSIKKISFETGINKETVLKAFERFEKDYKVFYYDNFIIIPNFIKHQKLNANMKKNVVTLFDDLPNSIKDKILDKGSESLANGSERFESLRKTLPKYEEGSMKDEKGNMKEEQKAPPKNSDEEFLINPLNDVTEFELSKEQYSNRSKNIYKEIMASNDRFERLMMNESSTTRHDLDFEYKEFFKIQHANENIKRDLREHWKHFVNWHKNRKPKAI